MLSYKYYVGAKQIFQPKGYKSSKSLAKRTLEDAITQAKELLEAHTDLDFAFVVQLVKVIKRQKKSIVVIDVK